VTVIAALAVGGYYAYANKLLPWQLKKPAASSTEKPAAADKAEESKEQK